MNRLAGVIYRGTARSNVEYRGGVDAGSTAELNRVKLEGVDATHGQTEPASKGASY